MEHRWVMDPVLTVQSAGSIHECSRCGAFEYRDGSGPWYLESRPSFRYTDVPSPGTCEEAEVLMVLRS